MSEGAQPATTRLLRLAVIVGSTREGRFGGIPAHWFATQAARRDDMDVDVIDLAHVGLPVVHPRQAGPDLEHYLHRLERADAFVVVTPEYNHGYPGPLKHAIDLAHSQWREKPVGFVSYGGRSGGLRVVEQLRQVFAELHAVTVRDTVSFHMAHTQFDDDGEPRDASGAEIAAKAMLDQLAWWGSTLRDARSVTA